MGNELSSTCSCYDQDAEKNFSDSNVFQKRPQERRKKDPNYDQITSQLTQSPSIMMNSTQPTFNNGQPSSAYGNQNTFHTSKQKSLYGFDTTQSNFAQTNYKPGTNTGPSGFPIDSDSQYSNFQNKRQQKLSPQNYKNRYEEQQMMQSIPYEAQQYSTPNRPYKQDNNKYEESRNKPINFGYKRPHPSDRQRKQMEDYDMEDQQSQEISQRQRRYEQQPRDETWSESHQTRKRKNQYDDINQKNKRQRSDSNSKLSASQKQQVMKVFRDEDEQGYLKKQARGGNTLSPRNRNRDIDMSEIKVDEIDAKINGYQSGKSTHSQASGKRATKSQNLGEVDDQAGLKKQKTLTMNDFKQFKWIKAIESRYLFGKTLGQGAFGTVRLCMHKVSLKTFAIKIMQKKAIEAQQIYVQLLQNELSILGEKSHPNIIRIVDLLEDNENYYIVSEVVKGGELFKRLTKVQNFTEKQAVEIVNQIMLGLNYMHLQSITHRDMKPENVLLVSDNPEDFRIKIADLGFASKYDKKKGLDLVLGTPLYMAPELVKHTKYSEKVDVWSLGVITYQLITGKTPFDSKNIQRINQKICSLEVTFTDRAWQKVSQDCKDFIAKCLDKNQNTRPSIAELLVHPWIKDAPRRQKIDGNTQLNIQKNLVQYQTCSEFQKIVLSLLSGLAASQEELEILQAEFLRLDRDKSGTLNRIELEEMTDPKLTKKYNIDWPTIIDCCDYNGDGVIDFQEFISACIDRKVLSNQDDVRKAFKIMDTNADGTLSLDDFDDLFNSYGGAKMDTKLWDTLLMEADKNGDGVVSLQEFSDAMGNLLRKELIKKRRNTEKTKR